MLVQLGKEKLTIAVVNDIIIQTSPHYTSSVVKSIDSDGWTRWTFTESNELIEAKKMEATQ